MTTMEKVRDLAGSGQPFRLHLADARVLEVKGRAWISMDSFQVVHLEAALMGGLPQIGLEELTLSVDYELVHAQSGNLNLQLPNRLVSYWDFSGHRIILVHSFDDFQLFAIDTEEKIQEPKEQ